MFGKPRDFFWHEVKRTKITKNIIFKTAPLPNNILVETHKVAYRITKCKKSHTIAELIL